MKNRGNFAHSSFTLSIVALVILSVCLRDNSSAAESQLIAYGGHNETMAPLGWALKRDYSESMELIPGYCKPAVDRS